MSGGVQMYTRPELDALTNADIHSVQHQTMMVRIKIFTNIDVTAIVTEEVRLDERVIRLSEELRIQQLPGLTLIGTQIVQLLTQVLGPLAGRKAFRFEGIDRDQFSQRRITQ